MWGGPDSIYTLTDVGTNEVLHFKISGKNAVVLLTPDRTYVVNGDAFFNYIDNLRSDYRSSSAVGLEGTEENDRTN
jgi:chitinase